MTAVIIFVMVILLAYVIISEFNDSRKEIKGICKTTGGTCTSPTGCTCGDNIEKHKH